MKTAANKTRPESDGKASANTVASRKGKNADAGLHSLGANNPHPLTGMLGSSPQVQQYTSLQKRIDTSPHVTAQMKQHGTMVGIQPIQRQEDEELLQGRFDPIQRQEDEELMQGKFETAQRQEDEEMLQGKFETTQRQEEEEMLQGKFEPVQSKEGPDKPPNKTGMPDQLKSGLENLSGLDMSDVRVHYNSSKPTQFSALAYTQGTDIHVAPGQEKHLSHEGWHAVQQMQGRVQPTTQVEGAAVNDNPGLEQEADVMGSRAVRRYR